MRRGRSSTGGRRRPTGNRRPKLTITSPWMNHPPSRYRLAPRTVWAPHSMMAEAPAAITHARSTARTEKPTRAVFTGRNNAIITITGTDKSTTSAAIAGR